MFLFFQRNPEGVVAITFKDPEEADVCIQALNGRWFAARQISAMAHDGKTKYHIDETEEEYLKRLKQWEDFLEGGSETDNKPENGTKQSDSVQSKDKQSEVKESSDKNTEENQSEENQSENKQSGNGQCDGNFVEDVQSRSEQSMDE